MAKTWFQNIYQICSWKVSNPTWIINFILNSQHALILNLPFLSSAGFDEIFSTWLYSKICKTVSHEIKPTFTICTTHMLKAKLNSLLIWRRRILPTLLNWRNPAFRRHVAFRIYVESYSDTLQMILGEFELIKTCCYSVTAEY